MEALYLKKLLITIVIIVLIGALGFAIYAAINHSTSSSNNQEQENKATHKRQKPKKMINKMIVQTKQIKIKIMAITLLMTINHLHSQMFLTTIQQHHRIRNQLSQKTQIQIKIILTMVVVNRQQTTKIINNRTHHLLINQIIPIRLLNKHLKHNHLKINHLPDTSTSIRYINQKNSNMIFFYLKYLTAVLYLHNSHSVKFI